MDTDLIKRYFYSKDLHLSPTERLVLFILACFRNWKTHQCNPSFVQIADKTGLCMRTVKTAVCRLKDKGFICYEGKRHTPNDYVFPDDGSASITLPRDEVVQGVSDACAAISAGSAANAPMTVQELHPKIIKEDQREVKEKIGDIAPFSQSDLDYLRSRGVPLKFIQVNLPKWRNAHWFTGRNCATPKNLSAAVSWWGNEGDKESYLDPPPEDPHLTKIMGDAQSKIKETLEAWL